MKKVFSLILCLALLLCLIGCEKTPSTAGADQNDLVPWYESMSFLTLKRFIKSRGVDETTDALFLHIDHTEDAHDYCKRFLSALDSGSITLLSARYKGEPLTCSSERPDEIVRICDEYGQNQPEISQCYRLVIEDRPYTINQTSLYYEGVLDPSVTEKIHCPADYFAYAMSAESTYEPKDETEVVLGSGEKVTADIQPLSHTSGYDVYFCHKGACVILRLFEFDRAGVIEFLGDFSLVEYTEPKTGDCTVLLKDYIRMFGNDTVSVLYPRCFPSSEEKSYGEHLVLAVESDTLKPLGLQYRGEPLPTDDSWFDLLTHGQYCVPTFVVENRALGTRVYFEYYDGVLSPKVTEKIHTGKDYLESVWGDREDAESVPVLLANGETVPAVVYQDPYCEDFLLVGFCREGAYITVRYGGELDEILEMLRDFNVVKLSDVL